MKGLIEHFGDITFHHIPHDDNQLVKALATLSSTFELNKERSLPLVIIQSHDQPTYCHLIEEESDRKPWYFNTKHREYPPSVFENNKKTLRRFVMSFFINGDMLNKINHGMVLLRCVNAKEVKQTLKEVHEGSFKTHTNEYAMARKILRVKYYWSNMENNCCIYVRKWHKCQTYANNTHKNAPIASYASVIRNVVVSKIIIDNATNLNNTITKELCKDFKIQNHSCDTLFPNYKIIKVIKYKTKSRIQT
ncbi:hypothetical protein CR513_08188, partial [Mucuna pruriens]